MTQEIIIKRGNDEVVLTEGRLKDLTSKFLEAAAEQASIYDDLSVNLKMVNTLVDVKKAWYPATQKNLNVNVENFDNKLKLWLEARKEMNKEKEVIEVKEK